MGVQLIFFFSFCYGKHTYAIVILFSAAFFFFLVPCELLPDAPHLLDITYVSVWGANAQYPSEVMGLIAPLPLHL